MRCKVSRRDHLVPQGGEDVVETIIVGVIVVSALLWAITYLVIRGVESAAFLNAVVMVVKVATILLFIAFSIVSFRAGIFTADFWGTAERNAVLMAAAGGDGLGSPSATRSGRRPSPGTRATDRSGRTA